MGFNVCKAFLFLEHACLTLPEYQIDKKSTNYVHEFALNQCVQLGSEKTSFSFQYKKMIIIFKDSYVSHVLWAVQINLSLLIVFY